MQQQRDEVPAPRRIMVVDDHIEMAYVLSDCLTGRGHVVETADGARAALDRMRACPPDAVISDLRMERLDGFDLLDAVKTIDASIPVLIMTAFGAIESAIEAIKRGAFHYFTKPFRLEEVVLYVERALKYRELREENAALRRLALERESFAAMVGRTAVMRELFDLVERVAHSSASTLILGESGTGKELIARALHFQGPRRAAPFLPVNCAALPETLLESELFGHARGAFTGATQPRRGMLLEADGGTLFLDEIGEMPLGLQSKLLRVLEDGEFRAVGADTSTRVDVRFVAATNQDLAERVRQGMFRRDLYYRLNVVPLRVPPLRERVADIPLLAEHLLAKARARNPTSPVRRLSPEVIQAFSRAPWLGNVRELENVIERLVIVVRREQIERSDLELDAPAAVSGASPLASALHDVVPLRQLENDYIAWVIARCGGNKTRAAELLGIDVSTIHRRRSSPS